MRNFSYSNIEFRRYKQEDWLEVTGEVTNNSGKNYSSVVFRIILFVKSIPVGNAMVTINGFYNGQTRAFERQVGELTYSAIAKDITGYEIYAEGGY